MSISMFAMIMHQKHYMCDYVIIHFSLSEDMIMSISMIVMIMHQKHNMCIYVIINPANQLDEFMWLTFLHHLASLVFSRCIQT